MEYHQVHFGAVTRIIYHIWHSQQTNNVPKLYLPQMAPIYVQREIHGAKGGLPPTW